MNLQVIVDALRGVDLLAQAAEVDTDILGIEVDSRAVHAGTLFIAIRGSVADGHKFIPQALANGASALVTEQPVQASIPVVVVRDGRRAAQVIAETWYDHPARQLQLVGITGTNGKTTTTAMMRHLLNRAGDAGSIGTLGAFDGAGDRVESSAGSLTTPGPLDLQATFRALVNRGVRHAAMETSSHALDQGRLDGVTFAAGIFTNVTREHLDYHGTMEQYLGAKLRLADRVATDGVLSLNADDPAWRSLRADRRALSWGTAARRRHHVADAIYSSSGTRFTLGGRFGTREVSIPFLGEFNVANAAGAATVALGLGDDAGRGGRAPRHGTTGAGPDGAAGGHSLHRVARLCTYARRLRTRARDAAPAGRRKALHPVRVRRRTRHREAADHGAHRRRARRSGHPDFRQSAPRGSGEDHR